MKSRMNLRAKVEQREEGLVDKDERRWGEGGKCDKEREV